RALLRRPLAHWTFSFELELPDGYIGEVEDRHPQSRLPRGTKYSKCTFWERAKDRIDVEGGTAQTPHPLPEYVPGHYTAPKAFQTSDHADLDCLKIPEFQEWMETVETTVFNLVDLGADGWVRPDDVGFTHSPTFSQEFSGKRLAITFQPKVSAIRISPQTN